MGNHLEVAEVSPVTREQWMRNAQSWGFLKTPHKCPTRDQERGRKKDFSQWLPIPIKQNLFCLISLPSASSCEPWKTRQPSELKRRMESQELTELLSLLWLSLPLPVQDAEGWEEGLTYTREKGFDVRWYQDGNFILEDYSFVCVSDRKSHLCFLDFIQRQEND